MPSCQSLNGTALLCLTPHASSSRALSAAAAMFILTTIAQVADGRRLRPVRVQGSLGRPLEVDLWSGARREGGRLLKRKHLVPRVQMQIQCYAVCWWSAGGVRSSFSLRRLASFAGNSGITGGDGLPCAAKQPLG